MLPDLYQRRWNGEGMSLWRLRWGRDLGELGVLSFTERKTAFSTI